MPSSSVVRFCTVCEKENTTQCAQCKCTSYCSQSCQRYDWKVHKLLCAEFASFPPSNRPTVNHYRAVFFDTDKTKPEFTWLRCTSDDASDDKVYHQHLDLETFIGGDTQAKDIPMQYNPKRERPLLNTVFIACRDKFFADGSQSNKSIASITDTQPGRYPDWRGPIVAFTKLGPGIEPTPRKDLDLVDFRHVADYFLSYGYEAPKYQASETNTSKTHRPMANKTEAQPNVECVKGVRINCLGDIKMLNRPHFEEVELPVTHPIFTDHETSDVADRIGIPILTCRCTPDSRWASSSKAKMIQGSSPFNNQDATFLHQCCNPRAESDPSTESLGWGWCLSQWQNNVGSVIVVRKDRKPLHTRHVEALTKYCRQEVGPVLAHSNGGYFPEEPISKDDALTIICRPMFVIYWNKFVEEIEDYTIPNPYYPEGELSSVF